MKKRTIFALGTVLLLAACTLTSGKYGSNECKEINRNLGLSTAKAEQIFMRGGSMSTGPEQYVNQLKAKGCYTKPYYADHLYQSFKTKAWANGCKKDCYEKLKKAEGYKRAMRYRAIYQATAEGK